MALKVVITEDGSPTILDLETGHTYHSTFGALSESEAVFIGNGLNAYCQSQPQVERLTIVEVGFGTGLNALLTLHYAQEKKIDITYYGIELYPLKEEVWSQLQVEMSDWEDASVNLHELHAMWNMGGGDMGEYFHLRPMKIDLIQKCDEVDFQLPPCDVVYHDAFAPGDQPEMWSTKVLTKIYQSLSEGGVWTTYASQGQLRRDLKSCGFVVERLSGPKGKREVLRAWKPIQKQAQSLES